MSKLGRITKNCVKYIDWIVKELVSGKNKIKCMAHN